MGRSVTSAVLAFAILLGLAKPGLVQSEDWETTRKQVIDPINSEIHRHLPTYVRERNLDEILSVYAVDTGRTHVGWCEPDVPRPGRRDVALGPGNRLRDDARTLSAPSRPLPDGR
jgi:hypothetical protein